jgi:ABC-2 type transport system permease protein
VVVSVLVGTCSLAALGFAVAGVVPSENAAPAVANVIVLPLEFMSGIFVPSEQIPDWMDTIASVFPVKPLFDSLFAAFDPLAGGIGVAWGDLAVVAAWGVAGVLLALRSFRWSPNR